MNIAGGEIGIKWGNDIAAFCAHASGPHTFFFRNPRAHPSTYVNLFSELPRLPRTIKGGESYRKLCGGLVLLVFLRAIPKQAN